MNHFFNKTTTFILVTMLVIASCMDDKDYYDPEYKTENPLEDIDIPDGFSWKNTRSSSVQVEVNDEFNGQYNYKIEIFDQNPIIAPQAKLISNGVAKRGKPFITQITTPTSIDCIFIRQTTPTGLVSVRSESTQPGNINCNFGAANTRATRGIDAITRGQSAIDTPDPNDTSIFPTQAPVDAKLYGTDNLVAGSSYKVTSTTKDINVWLGNISLYIVEDVELNSLYIAPNCKLFILPGVTVKMAQSTNNGQANCIISVGEGARFMVDNELKLDNDYKLYNLGTITSGTFMCTNTSLFYNAGTATISFKLSGQNGGVHIINEGDITADEMFVSGNSHVANYGQMTVKTSTVIDCTNGSWTNEGNWETPHMSIKGENTLSQNSCKLVVDGVLDINGSTMLVDGGASIEAKNLVMDRGIIRMGSKAFFNVTETATYNWHDTSRGFEGIGTERALLKMEKAIAQQPNSSNMIHYKGNLLVVCDNHPESTIDPWSIRWTLTNGAEWSSSTGSDIDIEASECTPGFSSKPGKEEDKDPEPITDPFAYTYLFEDSWPVYGDYDMNDVVVVVNNITKVPNKDGQIISMSFNFNLKAIGAHRSVAAALMLDGIKATDIASVAYSATQPYGFHTSSSGVESDQDMAVIPLFGNAHEFLNKPVGQYVNTEKNNINNMAETPTITVTVEFSSPMTDSFDASSFNLFIIPDPVLGTVTSKSRKEIHVVGYAPSKRVNTSIFGNGNDNSSANLYYISIDNLAWGIIIPDEFKWAVEYRSLQKVYPEFNGWAQSGGIENTDWWKKPDAGAVF